MPYFSIRTFTRHCENLPAAFWTQSQAQLPARQLGYKLNILALILSVRVKNATESSRTAAHECLWVAHDGTHLVGETTNGIEVRRHFQSIDAGGVHWRHRDNAAEQAVRSPSG